MTLAQIPSYATLVDQQFIQIDGPDGITTSYSYDQQQRTLYFKESQIIYPSFHGRTHIAEDLIPYATCDTPGLMGPDDKCKLDALLQTRLGVLGFQGAGFADDGGWMQGDVIFAAGTEFISLERIGNVIRFTVDSPIPLNCGCETCQQIFWVQDETEIASIRPPTCSGKLPGLNSYGEVKFYLFPESTIVDPNNPAATINNKGNYPSLIFKRYDDSIIPGAAEFDMVLQRNAFNSSQTQVGWSMTPGAVGVAQCVWFMGVDNDGNQLRFDLAPATDALSMGALLYNGNVITKKMGVIVDYTATVLTTNQYSIKEWNVDQQVAVGNPITAKNVWQYNNPNNGFSGANPKTLALDSGIDLLPIGTLIDLWAFQIGQVSGTPIYRYYFSEKPQLNPNNMWTWVDSVQFGDVAIARQEPNGNTDYIDAAVQVSAIKNLERTQWGLTGYDDPLFDFDSVFRVGTGASDISSQHRASIDTSLPGMRIIPASDALTHFSERPVWLWNRRNICNAIFRADIGNPLENAFTPYDIILRSTIDETTNKYARVVDKGNVNGLYYVRIAGLHFHDLPVFGAIRTLNGNTPNMIYNYSRKLALPSFHSGTNGTAGIEPDISVNPYIDTVVLVGGAENNRQFPGEIGDVVELLHEEYNSPCVRLEFAYNEDTQLIQLQVKVGVLDMSLPYENNAAGEVDDYVRGLAPGYAVSGGYSQTGTWTGIGTQPAASPDGFKVYDGGAQIGGTESEYWNRLEILLRDNQVWVWWNKLLIPPSASLSAALPTPVIVSTPYFTIPQDANITFGKIGMRLWPGVTLRRCDLRTQLTTFSEFTYGQLSIQ